MTSNKPGQADAALLNDTSVEEYLERHPEFFQGRDELLTRITLPHHSAGNAISLIERQVSLLRKQNRDYQRRLQELVQIARTNDELIGRLQQLALRLLDNKELDSVLVALENSLREDFHADAATLHLFGDPTQVIVDHDGRAFLHVDIVSTQDARQELQRLLPEGKPVCGVLRGELLCHLFGPRAEQVASTALLPLTAPDSNGGMRHVGLLAIGSNSDERFNAEMGTTYLQHLGELIGYRLGPCVPSQTA
jgi:uncharacterized protein